MSVKIFHHGDKHYDPFVIDRIMNHCLDGDLLGESAKMVSEVPEIAHAATERVKRASCLAFDLPPWDVTTGTGTQENVVMDTWAAFIDWREKKKVSTDPSPTLPASTASKPQPLSAQMQNAVKLAMASG